MRKHRSCRGVYTLPSAELLWRKCPQKYLYGRSTLSIGHLGRNWRKIRHFTLVIRRGVTAVHCGMSPWLEDISTHFMWHLWDRKREEIYPKETQQYKNTLFSSKERQNHTGNLRWEGAGIADLLLEILIAWLTLASPFSRTFTWNKYENQEKKTA